MNRLPLSAILPNLNQPRKNFRQDKLKELAASIETHGLLEPIVITPRDDGWMIIGGERRWRACGMTDRYADRPVPVRPIEADEQMVAEMALIENLQREDLDLIEEAQAYQDLLDRGMSVEQVAERLGISQPWRIKDRLSLLNLDPVFQDALVKKVLTPSQAYEMSRLSVANQRRLFKLIGDGKANTYAKLRSLANAMDTEDRQGAFFAPPDPREVEVRTKYDRMLEAVLKLVNGSFDTEDLGILKKALQGQVGLNIERIGMIQKHLSKIKGAMIEAHATQQVLTRN